MNELPEYNAIPSAPQLVDLNDVELNTIQSNVASNIDLVPNLPIFKSIRIGKHRLLLCTDYLIMVIQHSNISSISAHRSLATLEEVIRINQADKIEPTFIRIDKDTICYTNDRKTGKTSLKILDLYNIIMCALVY